MSGGFFEYKQHRCSDIADDIEIVLAGDNDYSVKTQKRLWEAVHCLRQAEEMAQRVDWLFSGDDSEETFHIRWSKEVRE